MFCFCQHNFAKQKSTKQLSYILRAKHCREDSEIWAEASLNLISRAKLNWISALTIWQVRNWAGTGKSCHTSFIITTPNNHIPLKLTFATWKSGLISSTACGDPLLLVRPTRSLCQSLERQRHLVKASLTFSWIWGPRLLGRWTETSPSFSGFAAKMRQNRAHIFLHHRTHTHARMFYCALWQQKWITLLSGISSSLAVLTMLSLSQADKLSFPKGGSTGKNPPGPFCILLIRMWESETELELKISISVTG